MLSMRLVLYLESVLKNVCNQGKTFIRKITLSGTQLKRNKIALLLFFWTISRSMCCWGWMSRRATRDKAQIHPFLVYNADHFRWWSQPRFCSKTIHNYRMSTLRFIVVQWTLESQSIITSKSFELQDKGGYDSWMLV